MADYKTHITTSTILGVGYAAAGHFYWHFPVETCVLAGGLCSVSGMLPDLDSDSGRPVQEMTGFAAAVIPMLMLERFQEFGWSREMMTLAAVVIYVVVRFGVAELFKRYTVHR
ncbi:MAG: metal-dependent hydrolase, partial [Pirellulaceae bacterium]